MGNVVKGTRTARRGIPSIHCPQLPMGQGSQGKSGMYGEQTQGTRAGQKWGTGEGRQGKLKVKAGNKNRSNPGATIPQEEYNTGGEGKGRSSKSTVPKGHKAREGKGGKGRESQGVCAGEGRQKGTQK